MTLSQISAREDFAKRIAAEKPVYLHECLYPLMQGWDSVEIRADVELGGTEQLFSLLVARDLQQGAGAGAAGGPDDADPGRDGRRAADGKEPGQRHRRRAAPRGALRQTDEHPRRADPAVLHALTDLPLAEVDAWLAPGVNPRDAKEALARTIVAGLTSGRRRGCRRGGVPQTDAWRGPRRDPRRPIDRGQLETEGRLPARA